MTHNNINITDILLSKYFSGNASEEEANAILMWKKASEANRKEFDQSYQVWQLTMTAGISKLDPDAAWNKVNARAKVTKKPTFKVQRFYSNMLKVAAVLVVSLLTWFTYDRYFSTVRYYADANIENVILEDGTNVTLNKNSWIEAPKHFRGSLRKVSMTGEAFFNVKHDASHPFIIETKNAAIKVLGTSFNVKTMPEGNINVTVATGRVAFMPHNTKEAVILSKGEYVSWNESKKELRKARSANQNYLAWKTHRFEFKENKLDSVIKAINAIYNSEIALGKEVSQLKLTARFDSLSIEQIVETLKVTFNLKAENTNTGLVLVKK
ncbi:MAG TPA: FecR domain-containing protein [Bacteroidales bacterium]|nr:FecR domain-containing protein [Bacteroidales bacterium]